MDRHDVALVLGSGWLPAAELLGTASHDLPVTDLPGFAPPSVDGHAGRIRSVVAGDKRVLVFLGRTHLYEGRGVAVSQVVPLPTSEGEALGRDYVKQIGGVSNASFASLEGYIGARVLVEGLKKAGKAPTRESLVDALERLGTIDLAGFKVKFAPGNHNGSSLVELTVIGAQGLYRR